jgi:hypothetical protein
LVAVGLGVLGGMTGTQPSPERAVLDTHTVVKQVAAEYQPKIAQARLRIPEDEKLIAAQKEVVVAQTAQIRRAAEQQRLKELEEGLAEDQQAVQRLEREQKEEVDRRLAQARTTPGPPKEGEPTEKERQRREEGARKDAEDARKAEDDRRQRAEQEEARKAAEAENARRMKEAQDKKAVEDEGSADRRLAYAQKKLDDGKPLEAAGYLNELIKKYPNTKAADKARQLLKKIRQ